MKPQRWHPLWGLFFKVHAALYRLTGGALGRNVSGVPVLVLTHIGARSGKLRQTALYYCEDGRNLAVIASKLGEKDDPAWYRNLMTNQVTEVQLGRLHRPVRARLASEAERARIWQRMVSVYPDYDGYQRRTERRIPVVVLEPIAAR